MKTLNNEYTPFIAMIIIAIALVLFGASQLSAQTIAKGDILSNEPYTVLIEHINKDNQKELIRWEVWEYIDAYDVKADAFMRIKAIFLSKCTGDTLATAYFNGGLSREKIRQDIILDGSTYELGTNPYAAK